MSRASHAVTPPPPAPPLKEEGRKPAVQTPANVEPFVRVLGAELAIAFLLQFGGAELAFSRRPQARGALTKLVGPVKASALAEACERLPARIPLAKGWIAKVLLTKGVPVAEIARRLRVSDVTVRKMTKVEREERQLRLL